MRQVSAPRIPVAGPWITERETNYVADAAANAWGARANEFHERFERAFRERVGSEFAVALPSCTSAIHLALLALGIGPGDEVIVPDLTWIATAAPIQYVGATPIFAAVDPETWCIDTESVEANLSPRTKAIIPVDLYGQMPFYGELVAVAKKHGLAVIEDAAEALGSELYGHMAGTFGDIGVFSFHGSKTMTTGEGGMLVTNCRKIYERVLVLRDHGRQPGNVQFFNDVVAHKYKMSSMQAAMGLGQIERLAELVDKKREIFAAYKEELGGIEGLQLNQEREGLKSSYWMSTVLFDSRLGISKEQAAAFLSERGIDTRPFFHPLSALPAYASAPAAKAALRHREQVSFSARGLNLPSGLQLTRSDIARVGEAVRALVRR